VINVSDSRSNANDQIARAATIIGRSKDKAKVFRAVYHGKRQYKTVEELMRATGMSRKRVREDAAKLANQHLFGKTRRNGDVVYERETFMHANKDKILRLAGNKEQLKKFPTKTNPGGGANASINLRLPRRRVQVTYVTLDDIDSFRSITGISAAHSKLSGMSEKAFKQGVKGIIGEKGEFTDWGGEKNDLLSTRLLYKGKRRRVAFAFKGPGTGGTLTPGKLGKNGDQIQRLFSSDADVYLIQYWNQIDESVPEQMRLLATAKSYLEDREIFYGIVDGTDSVRLVAAYPKKFSRATTKRGKDATKKKR
jgi:hypothetical protein